MDTLAYGRRCAPTAPAPPVTRRRAGPPPPEPDRRAARRLASERSGVPAYQLDLVTVRGACRARRCPSRWGVVRLTVDLRDREVDRYAAVECASCGRVWRRVRLSPVRTRRGFQRVLVTAILPASAHRWYARGRWHREGDDAVVMPNVSLGELDEAVRAFRERQGRVLARLQRAKDRRAALEAAAMVEYRALRERLDARAAERAAEERAAAAREE